MFVTAVGEEQSTQHAFDIPGTDLKATVAIFYTDGRLVTPVSTDSGEILLYIGKEAAQDCDAVRKFF